ncbi:MAG: class I SAM-dependent methyltransferase [Actinomycetota bacterium]|nr:class I SAM-dependent methyltransferase [Actinomycetota bacterium]
MVALNSAIDAYGAAADAWAAGPGRMYNALSRAVVAQCPVALAGARVLDLGAGTGSASVAASDLGADIIAVDGAIDMLRYDQHLRPPAAVGDARSLPVSSGSFDCVVAAFVLNHLDEPARALREICRVLRPEGVVVASTYAAGWDIRPRLTSTRSPPPMGSHPLSGIAA